MNQFYDLQSSPFGTYVILHSKEGITDIYFSEKVPKLTKKKIDIKKAKLDLQGTEFQKQVWQELKKIKKGQLVTYTYIAEKIGKPKAYRAVASAIAKNRIAILIPCHRVIPNSGGVGEYRWGVERKMMLIESESNAN